MTEGTLGYDVDVQRVPFPWKTTTFARQRVRQTYLSRTFHALGKYLSASETSTLLTPYHPCGDTDSTFIHVHFPMCEMRGSSGHEVDFMAGCASRPCVNGRSLSIAEDCCGAVVEAVLCQRHARVIESSR